MNSTSLVFPLSVNITRKHKSHHAFVNVSEFRNIARSARAGKVTHVSEERAKLYSIALAQIKAVYVYVKFINLQDKGHSSYIAILKPTDKSKSYNCYNLFGSMLHCDQILLG